MSSLDQKEPEPPWLDKFYFVSAHRILLIIVKRWIQLPNETGATKMNIGYISEKPSYEYKAILYWTISYELLANIRLAGCKMAPPKP